MTCKDCVHYELCKMYARFGVTDLPYNDETICDHFKNKANVIELPCELGSEIYMLVTRHTKSFEWENKKMILQNNQHTFIKKTTFTKSNLFKVIDDFGKTVFLTKEEAEQKLKGGAEQ